MEHHSVLLNVSFSALVVVATLPVPSLEDAALIDCATREHTASLLVSQASDISIYSFTTNTTPFCPRPLQLHIGNPRSYAIVYRLLSQVSTKRC